MSAQPAPRAGSALWTDGQNAERLLSTFATRLRHHPAAGWLVWDEKRWAQDEKTVREYAKDTARSLYTEALSLPGQDQTRGISWAARCDTPARVDAMLRHAESDFRVRLDDLDSLDANPYSLNTPSGLVDLRSGSVRPSEPVDLVSKITAARYRPGAIHPAWDSFLERFLPEPELRALMQTAVGYSLSGDTSLKLLFFIHGPKDAGKSTFMRAIQAALGEYALTAGFDTFLAQRDARGASNDLARLAGARFVSSIEVEKGRKLAEGLVKQLTGGDRIAARFLHREFFEFVPRFKLWLVANDRPRADAQDDALWRRIIVLPFTHSISPADANPAAARALTEDPKALEAVLSWAIKGAQAFFDAGQKLSIPDQATQAAEEYRAENDELAGFFDECCEFADGLEITRKDLFKECRKWCEENGVHPPGTRVMADVMRRRNAGLSVRRGVRYWTGVDLRSDRPFLSD